MFFLRNIPNCSGPKQLSNVLKDMKIFFDKYEYLIQEKVGIAENYHCVFP